MISDGELWMETIKARNLTSHAYDEDILQRALEAVSNDYIVIFERLFETFKKIEEKEKSL